MTIKTMIKNLRRIGCCLLIVVMYQGMSHADVGNDLDNFFNKLGYKSNTTVPDAYYSQAAGGFGSGSLYVRNQVRNYQLIQLDMPNMSGGCAGIDLYTGSISFLRGSKLKQLGKAVMSNAAAYSFDVALASTIPQLKQIKDYLQAMEQSTNRANVNSCQLSQNLVGGIWPKTKASQEKICHDQGTMGNGGYFSDYVKARMGCNGNDFNKVLSEADRDPKRKEQVVMNRNIVWSLLKSKSSFNSDNEMMELIMSMTGIIIIDKNGHVTNVPSLIKSQSLIQALLGDKEGVAKNAKIWSCKEKDKCMAVQLKKINIEYSKSLRAKVSDIIQNLYKKLIDDKEPTAEEKTFLGMTHIPIWKFMTVLASTESGVEAVDLDDYSSLIAQSLLAQYLLELLQEVHNVTANSQLTDSIIDVLEKRIKDSQMAVAEIVPEIRHHLDEKLKLIENIRVFEKQLVVETQSSLYGQGGL